MNNMQKILTNQINMIQSQTKDLIDIFNLYIVKSLSETNQAMIELTNHGGQIIISFDYRLALPGYDKPVLKDIIQILDHKDFIYKTKYWSNQQKLCVVFNIPFAMASHLIDNLSKEFDPIKQTENDFIRYKVSLG